MCKMEFPELMTLGLFFVKLLYKNILNYVIIWNKTSIYVGTGLDHVVILFP